MKKILCIVQARMGSSRLPGKVMKLLNGKPMITYTLEALKRSKYINQVILATSNKKQDDELANYVESLGIEVFRGDEDNVLKRYKLASDKYKGDIIVRVTGDCPLINPIICDNVITHYLMYDYDYVRLDVPNSFQRGFDTEVFSKEVLDKVDKIVEENEDSNSKMYKEHVTYYIYSNEKNFKIGIVSGKEDFYKNKHINLSVDTKEDFDRVNNYLK